MERYPYGWEDFSKNTHFFVGIGNRVRFWQHGWCGDQPLQLAFPGLYGIATDRKASVESSLTRLGARERSWDVLFIWDLNDWELNTGEDFLRILRSKIPSTDIGDWMRWKLKPDGDFDIRLFYNKLRGSSSVVFF